MLQITGVSAARLKDGRTAIDLMRRRRRATAFPASMKDKEVWVAYLKEHMEHVIVNTEAELSASIARRNAIKSAMADIKTNPI